MSEDAAQYEASMARCAARETFEETGLLLGFRGTPPSLEEQRTARREILSGSLDFWPSVERWGLEFDPASYRPCGRWITPHFSRARFDTSFFLVETDDLLPLDVWPGELESGEWVEPRAALRQWDEDRIVLAMPTLHTIRVLAEGADRLPGRLHEIPEANGVPSRHVHVRPAITMVPLRSETIPPATHTNATVIGDGNVLIIDPATPDEEELGALDRVVREALGAGGRVLAILLTHRHRDHVGGAEAARARYGAPVWGHALCAECLRIDRELREGDAIDVPGNHPRRVRVLEAPGHARSHLAFLEETSRTLVAGDIVSGISTVVIDPPDGNMRDYLETLARLRGLHLAALIPGHGAPHRGVDRLLDALIEHRRMRESRILRTLQEGPVSEGALRERVYADTPGADPVLAAKTLRAHLEKLEQEGRISRRGPLIALAG